MVRMASEFAFPARLKVKSPWSLQVFKAQSTEPSAWIAPIREELLRVYLRTNEAVAKSVELVCFISALSSAYDPPEATTKQSK